MARTSPRPKPRAREAIREEARAAYREAILEAAAQVFGRLGFHDAKMADIAAAAGVAAGTLYNYFTSKEEVFASIRERGQQRLLELFAAAAVEPDPLARLRALARVLFGFLQEHGALFRVHLHLGGLAEWSRQQLGEPLDHDQARLLAVLERTIADAQGRGELRGDLPADELAALFGGLIDAAIFAWARRGCPPDLIAKADTVLDTFLYGAEPR